jgi:uncharacterized membrane protein YgcG
MNRTLLQEVKAMNKIAGTQMTKEQEIAFIKTRLNELEFTHQASFDAYKKTHKMRPDTKVKIAGKDTTAGEASKKPGMLQKLGAKLFGKKEEPIQMPKIDPKNPINNLKVFDLKRGSDVSVGKIVQNPEKYKHLAAKVQSLVDVDPEGKEDAIKLDKEKKRRKETEKMRKDYKEKELQKQKELEKWRKENPELAAKMDKEEAERKKKEEEERIKDRNRRIKMLRRGSGSDTDYGSSKFGSSGFGGSSGGSGFGGFGGGSFGGAGAGGSW